MSKRKIMMAAQRNWWKAGRNFSRAEIVADGIVHGVGILAALSAGSILLVTTLFKTAPSEAVAAAIYVGTLISVLSVSLAFNMWPATPAKQLLARLDQATIFLFIAGTYTPFLVVMSGSSTGAIMLAVVWGTALCGVALKLIVPQAFGHFALLLYLAIGCSGVAVFQGLAEVVPAVSLWLLLAGCVLYTLGIIFHLWERLKFQTALWHSFVVVAATLHFGAVLELMIRS